MAYQYKGTVADIEEEPTPIRTPARGPFDPLKCGTYAGYKQHQNRGLTPCQDCKDAQAAYSRDWAERRGGRPAPKVTTFNPDACGTYAGWTRHLRSEVEACEACHAAWLQYRREWRARKKVGA